MIFTDSSRPIIYHLLSTTFQPSTIYYVSTIYYILRFNHLLSSTFQPSTIYYVSTIYSPLRTGLVSIYSRKDRKYSILLSLSFHKEIFTDFSRPTIYHLLSTTFQLSTLPRGLVLFRFTVETIETF